MIILRPQLIDRFGGLAFVAFPCVAGSVFFMAAIGGAMSEIDRAKVRTPERAARGFDPLRLHLLFFLGIKKPEFLTTETHRGIQSNLFFLAKKEKIDKRKT